MYELIILSLLVGKPMRGYAISKVINNIVGPFAKISNGRLYPLLQKLAESELIVGQNEAGSAPTGGGNPHHYLITQAGRDRFRMLMLDVSSNPGDYRRIFMYKVSALHFLPVADQLYIIEHYINFCQAHLHFQTAVEEVWEAEARSVSVANAAAAERIAKHLHGQWQLELDWAVELRGQVNSVTNTDTSPASSQS